VKYAEEKKIQFPRSENYQAKTGRGAEAQIDGHLYFVGNHRFAHESAVCSDELRAVEFFEQQRWGNTPACVKCGSVSFELKETVLTGSPWKLYFVQCSQCGGVVSVLDDQNIGRMLRQRNESLRQIPETQGITTSLATGKLVADQILGNESSRANSAKGAQNANHPRDATGAKRVDHRNARDEVNARSSQIQAITM
jgi:hypothetical protein